MELKIGDVVYGTGEHLTIIGNKYTIKSIRYDYLEVCGIFNNTGNRLMQIMMTCDLYIHKNDYITKEIKDFNDNLNRILE
jgi:hypothetical protein